MKIGSPIELTSFKILLILVSVGLISVVCDNSFEI